VRRFILLASCVAITLGGNAAAADDAQQLLKIEIEFIVDLLHLNKPVLAQKHLDIIKKEFPDSRKVVNYYQGVINYQQKAYDKALKEFKRLPLSGSSDESDIRYYLFSCHVQLKQYDDAHDAIKEMERVYGKTRLAANARMLLARELYKRSGTDAAKPTDRQFAVVLVRDVVKNFPKHTQASWLKYIEAEDEYERLARRLANHSPKPLTDELRPQVKRVLKLYDSIRTNHPDSREAKNATIRADQLRDLLGE
jgi:tetratricopeptide (TPR) repeat protein